MVAFAVEVGVRVVARVDALAEPRAAVPIAFMGAVGPDGILVVLLHVEKQALIEPDVNRIATAPQAIVEWSAIVEVAREGGRPAPERDAHPLPAVGAEKRQR